MEMENIWSTEEKKNGEGKGGIICGSKINGDANQPTHRPTGRIYSNLPFLKVRKEKKDRDLQIV